MTITPKLDNNIYTKECVLAPLPNVQSIFTTPSIEARVPETKYFPLVDALEIPRPSILDRITKWAKLLPGSDRAKIKYALKNLTNPAQYAKVLRFLNSIPKSSSQYDSAKILTAVIYNMQGNYAGSYEILETIEVIASGKNGNLPTQFVVLAFCAAFNQGSYLLASNLLVNTQALFSDKSGYAELWCELASIVRPHLPENKCTA